MAGFTSVRLAVFGLVLGAVAWPVQAAVNISRESLVRKELPAPEDIQGYPCAAGYAWFFTDGRLRECAVFRSILFGEITVPQASWINLHNDGQPDFVFLAHDSPINGYICKGGGVLGPTEGAATALHPSGKLKTCWLAADTQVVGIPCVHASILGDVFGGGSGTEFYENGKLKSCKLSRDIVIDHHTLGRGDHIHLDATGQLTAANAPDR